MRVKGLQQLSRRAALSGQLLGENSDKLERGFSSKPNRNSQFTPPVTSLIKPGKNSSQKPQKNYLLETDEVYRDSFWPSRDNPSFIFGVAGFAVFGYGFWDMVHYELTAPEWYYLLGGTAAWVVASFEYVLNWRSLPHYISSIRLHPDKSKIIIKSGVFKKRELTYHIKDISYRTLVKHLHKEQEWTYMLEVKGEDEQLHKLEMCARTLWNKGNLKVQPQVMEDILKGDIQELLKYRVKGGGHTS